MNDANNETLYLDIELKKLNQQIETTQLTRHA